MYILLLSWLLLLSLLQFWHTTVQVILSIILHFSQPYLSNWTCITVETKPSLSFTSSFDDKSVDEDLAPLHDTIGSPRHQQWGSKGWQRGKFHVVRYATIGYLWGSCRLSILLEFTLNDFGEYPCPKLPSIPVRSNLWAFLWNADEGYPKRLNDGPLWGQLWMTFPNPFWITKRLAETVQTNKDFGFFWLHWCLPSASWMAGDTLPKMKDDNWDTNKFNLGFPTSIDNFWT